MNPFLKLCFIQYYGKKMVNSVKENFMGNAKEYHDTSIRYEVSYRSWIVDRIEIRLDFRPPCYQFSKERLWVSDLIALDWSGFGGQIHSIS